MDKIKNYLKEKGIHISEEQQKKIEGILSGRS